jgi:hypothetical protein
MASLHLDRHLESLASAASRRQGEAVVVPLSTSSPLAQRSRVEALAHMAASMTMLDIAIAIMAMALFQALESLEVSSILPAQTLAWKIFSKMVVASDRNLRVP